MLEMCSHLVLAALYFGSVEAVIDPATISAAASAIIAGTSIAGTTLNALTNLDYWVVCGIEVENWTKYTLSDPNVQIADGVVETPAVAILPGRREAMVARKTAHTATGSYGTVSWRIDCDANYPSRRAIVMWSAPFNFDHYNNWLGLGFTKPGQLFHPSGDCWFDRMYYGSPGAGVGFARKDYKWDLSTLIYEDDKFRIVGTMSSSHKATVKVTVRPKSKSDLADSIKAILPK